jgi:glycosyltransferase involved in cell wall biosynthesis
MTLGLAGGVFKAVRRAPVLLDVVDLWPEAVLGSGMVKSGAIVGIAAWIAKTSYRIADQITVPTDGFASQLQSVGVPAAKVTVVPNWADGELYYQSERDLAFGDEFGLRDKMCVIHAGNIGPFQDIENVLSAAQLLRHDDHLRFVFVGGGRDLEKMRVLKKDRKLDNVVFAGFYPAERMSGILAWGDALLVSLKADPYLAINLPGKLPSYMATGRPIIACADGEASQLVLTKGLGSSCEPGNAAALASTIQRFMGLPVESRLEIGARCRQVFEALFEKNRLIGKYVSMLEHLANR